MGNIDWSALINQGIGKIFDLVFGGIGGFFAAWLAYRYSIKSDLNKIKAELNQNITKDQIAKENQKLDELWQSTRMLMEKASILTAMYKEYPDFNYMSADALDEFIQSSFLSERQKKELLSSPDRNKYYQKAKTWHDYNETRLAFNILLTSVQGNRIHIPKLLLDEYDKFIKAMNDLLISFEIWLETNEHSILRQIYKDIEQIREITVNIEQQSRDSLEKYLLK
ncbi:MAG: hypothetical protein WCA79_16735 [Anaerolineales bacterium]